MSIYSIQITLKFHGDSCFHQLVIESERKCLVCESDSVEDELHFLFYCSQYSKLRQDWYSNMELPINFDNLDSNLKLNIVLNDNSNVKQTAKFISNAFNLRTSL